MEYTLKDKLNITKDFLKDLEEKSWLEIDHLQNQITNIEDNAENKALIQLLKNLLTGYYIFVGGLENLDSNITTNKAIDEVLPEKEDTPKVVDTTDDDYLADLVFDEPVIEKSEPVINDYSEPFEYFVDFDEPIGDPLTDDDLYNN
jgi:hypothetical protein